MNVSATGLFFGVSALYVEYKPSCALPIPSSRPDAPAPSRRAVRELGGESESVAAAAATAASSPNPDEKCGQISSRRHSHQ
jgi:hypothetical protein